MVEPRAVETGVYLLTPTHIGVGQAAGAVDLPIAREAHTGWPLLPSTALKGVLRSLAEPDGASDSTKQLFGSAPPGRGKPGDSLRPGDLVFNDGLLLAFPARSLIAPFLWVTCPMVIARWRRARQAWGLPVPSETLEPGTVAATFQAGAPIVIEDLVFEPDGQGSEGLTDIARMWTDLLPAGDGVAQQLPQRLVCVPDRDFTHLVEHHTLVQARVQLTDGKTTDKWSPSGDPDAADAQEGNLWYEESLPQDCLFSAVIAARPGKPTPYAAIHTLLASQRRIQIGGNETVGQGLAMWCLPEAKK